MRFSLSSAFKFSFALLLCMLCISLRAQAQIVSCNPGPGGPPPGSIPRAIAQAPPLAILPNVPIPGSWLWVLYENRHLTLLHLPTGWPATPANQVITMNLDTLPGFGIPANFALYDVAIGPGNIGLGIFYSSAWVIGRNPATGEQRAQRVGLSPGAPPGGCFISGAAQVINPGPASIGAVQYPDGYITNHFWVLRPADPAIEPGTSTPDQTITLQHVPTGVAVLAPVDEDQILCAPGVSCPNWGNTLIQQMTGDAVHLLLRNQTTGAQSVGWLNLGNAGFGGFNSCAGSVNPCLYQRANLPAPISGNVIDIAGETFIPDRVWVLWAEEIVAPGAAPPGDEESVNGPSALFESLASASTTVVYRLGAINGNGSLLGSMTISTIGDSGSGGGSGSGISVTPPKIDFGPTPVGGRGEGIYNIRNLTRSDLIISSMSFSSATNSPFSFCDPIRLPFSLQPQEQREFRVCFQPQTAGAFQNSIVIRGGAANAVLATVHLTGQAAGAAGQLAAKLNLDRGCGTNYRVGDPMTINFQLNFQPTVPSSQPAPTTALTTLKIRKPGAPEQVLFTGSVRLGLTYSLRSIVGDPPGERELRLETEIVALQLTGSASCSFTAAAQDKTPKKPEVTLYGLVSVKDKEERQNLLIQFSKFRLAFIKAINKNYDPATIEPQGLTQGGVGDVLDLLNKGNVSILVAHGSGNNFTLPDGSYATAADVNKSKVALSNVRILALLSCFSGEDGALGKAFAARGAKVVLTPTTLMSDDLMAEFVANFLRLLADGKPLNEALKGAKEETRKGKAEAEQRQVDGITMHPADGIDPTKPFSLSEEKK